MNTPALGSAGFTPSVASSYSPFGNTTPREAQSVPLTDVFSAPATHGVDGVKIIKGLRHQQSLPSTYVSENEDGDF
eukprot:UN02821